MVFSEMIHSALDEYENKKGIWRRLFSIFGFGKAPAIKALYKLIPNNRTNAFQIVQCFIKNMPNKSQASYQVYRAVMHDTFGSLKETVLDAITQNLTKLHKTDLLTQENFDGIKAHDRPEWIASLLVSLNSGEILTQVNREAIKAQVISPEKAQAMSDAVAYALVSLNSRGILTQENREAVKAHARPKKFAYALVSLNSGGILTQENREAVKVHDRPEWVAAALVSLNSRGILTQENREAVKAHDRPEWVAAALVSLNSAEILTQENREVVKAHDSPEWIASILVSLNSSGILTQENREAVIAHDRSETLVAALVSLNSGGILTQENREAVKAHDIPQTIAAALVSLNSGGILTQENREAVKAHDSPQTIEAALASLISARILNQANFDLLLNPNNNFLLSARTAYEAWLRIPSHLLTQAVFDQFVEFSQRPNPEELILRYVERLLNARARAQDLNNAQSTHTTSIHISVSASATKLWQHYGGKLQGSQLEKIITKVKNDISNLPASLENDAAKRCIEKIAAHSYHFTDPSSNVTTRQLLALSYLAISDDENRSGSLEDAEKQFINGLYEIQRGYNLSASGIDDQSPDRPICTAGTFNKLVEKLSGIHPDVELIFVTKATATQKLPIIVREEVKNYLNQLSSPEQLSVLNRLSSFVKLINQLQEDGIEVIWEDIQPKVADRVFDEFGSLFINNSENSEFLTFVDNGKYVELEDLNIYQQCISNSPKCDEYRNRPQPSFGFFSTQQTQNSNANNTDLENAVSAVRQRSYDN